MIFRIFILTLGTCAAGAALALDDQGLPLADIVRTLLAGGTILSKLMWAVCIVVGIALIAAAFTQFQIHRRNPKLVPLATPVMYLILGILAIAIPFLGQMQGFLGPPPPSVRNQAAPPANRVYNPNDIDAPLN